jgi:hypothetical protein
VDTDVNQPLILTTKKLTFQEGFHNEQIEITHFKRSDWRFDQSTKFPRTN